MIRLIFLIIAFYMPAYADQQEVDEIIYFASSKLNTKKILNQISKKNNIQLKYLRIPKIGVQEWKSLNSQGIIVPIKDTSDGSCSLNWVSDNRLGSYIGWPYCDFVKKPVFLDIDGDGFKDIIYTIDIKTSIDGPIYTHEFSLIYRLDSKGFCLSSASVPWYVFNGTGYFTPYTLQCP
ncbi:hypothetical protein [Comamonas sp. NoAH]|uniref:hypothetical protein n=1 Tax=Comamonas halotolerans TaxID=3041496 RepID=UPI0024E12365|nr:hypothetical protein [Comamonas sp. NoAH]